MEKQSPNPLAYLLTISCYSSHLHGDPRGSVTIYVNEPGAPTLPPNPELLEQVQRRMKQQPYRLDRNRRRIVLRTIIEVCAYKDWPLYAVHVRPTHVHVVLWAPLLPEPVMNTVKARCSFRLNQSRLDYPGRKRWTRHGSTRYLWTRDSVRNAVKYTIEEQGEPMEIFRAAQPSESRSIT